MFSDYTRTTISRSQEQLPLSMDDGPEMDRGLPAVLRQRDRWVSPRTEKKIEEAWGPRGSRHICQVCQMKCFSHRALRLHVDAHFLLYFCSCGFHDVFPYPVTLHKMDCFAGENHIVDEDCFPEFVNTIRPVIKKAITLAALDVGFQQLLFTAHQQSPLIRSPPTVTTDNATPPETEKSEPPPQPRPSRLATVEERLLRLQEEFTQLAPDLLSTTTGLYQLKESVGRLKRRLCARQARHRSQSLQQ